MLRPWACMSRIFNLNLTATFTSGDHPVKTAPGKGNIASKKCFKTLSLDESKPGSTFAHILQQQQNLERSGKLLFSCN